MGLFFALSALTVFSLDRMLFSARNRFARFDLGTWNELQWRARRHLFASRPGDRPLGYLFLGDSSVGYGISPSLIEPDSFNLGRLGLQDTDLDDLGLKLEVMLPVQPKVVFLGMLWYEFLGLEADDSSLASRPPSLGKVLGHFYDRPQSSQRLLLPGSRIARYGLDAWLGHFERVNTHYFELAPDGQAEFLHCPPPVEQPGKFPHWDETKPGWFDAAHLAGLKRFVATLNGRNLQQFFIFMPMHPGCRDKYLQTFGKEHAQWKKAINELYEGRVIDMEDTMAEAKWYRDAAHLNKAGAAQYSRLLKIQIEASLASRSPAAAGNPGSPFLAGGNLPASLELRP